MKCQHPRAQKTHDYAEARLFRCPDCQLVFSDRHAGGFDPASLYDTFYNNEVSGRFRFGIEAVIRSFRFFRAFKVFTIAPAAARILDIGSGRGFMLYYLKKYYRYRRAAGTQIARNMFEFSRDRLGLEVYNTDLLDLDLGPGQFDIVTAWHVLEHLPDPESYLQAIHRLLVPGGRLAIEVPNYDSWTRWFTGRYWLGLDLQYHINFFTPPCLVALLEKNGFAVKKVRTFSLEYSTFISSQSLASWLTRTDQLFFTWLQDGRPMATALLHGALIALIAPLALLVNVALYWSRRGEVLLVIAERGERTPG